MTAPEQPGVDAAELAHLSAAIARVADTLSQAATDEPDGMVPEHFSHPALDGLAGSVNRLLENMRASLRAQRRVCDLLEQEADDRAARLKLIVDGSNDGFWVWNLQTDRLGVSDRWCEMIGRPPLPSEDNRPSLWLDQVHPDDRPALEAAIELHLRGKTLHVSSEYRMHHADGTDRWMLCRGLCRHDVAGQALVMAGTQTDITSRRHIDALTGHPNERFFRDRLIDAIGGGDAPSAAVIGLNRRANLLESLSPGEVGELTGRIFAGLTGCLPRGMPLAQLPGETFGVILPGLPPDQAASLIEEVLEQVFGQSFSVGGDRLWLTASAGIASTATAESRDPDTIISAAWAALRRVRSDGSTRGVAVYHPDQRRYAEQQIAAETMLREGLLQDRVVPYFQPIMHLASGTLHGFEALVRIVGTDGSIVSPGEFIPVAERTGLVTGIGEVMLRRSLAALSGWRRSGVVDENVTMSVNLAVAQLADSGLPEQVRGLLEATEVPPHCLKLEVTETVMVEDDHVALATLNKLREIGVRVVMDDFGTGYSSLSYLRRLPVDTIKIDRSFVSGIDHLPGKRVIAETICSLGRVLDLDIVAEGVETAAEEAVVMELGVQFAQGYRYGRAMTAAAVEASPGWHIPGAVG